MTDAAKYQSAYTVANSRRPTAAQVAMAIGMASIASPSTWLWVNTSSVRQTPSNAPETAGQMKTVPPSKQQMTRRVIAGRS